MPEIHRKADDLDLLVKQKNKLEKIKNRDHYQSDEFYQKQVQIDEQIEMLKKQLAELETHVN